MLCTTDATRKLFTDLGLHESDWVSLELTKSKKEFTARIYAKTTLDGEATYPSYKALRAITRIPERKSLSNDKSGIPRFHLGISDYTVEILNSCFKNNIYHKDSETRIVFQSQLLQSRNADLIAKRTAEYFKYKTVPPNNLKIADGFEMTCYQQVAAINSCYSSGYGLFFKQGCGKTLVPISLISSFAKHVKESTGAMHRSLVVCPNNVRMNWRKELERFSNCSVKTVVLEGTYLDRLRAMIYAFQDEGHDALVCIIGYDTIPVFQDAIKHIDWNLGVLDESHYIKSSNTTRWEFIEPLRDKCEKRLVLTGTPYANSLLDLYTQLEWIGKGCSGFTSFAAFKRFHGVFDTDYSRGNGKQDGIEKLVGFQNVPFLQERLARHSFIITKEQAMPDLPEKTFDVIESTMTKEQSQVYKDLATKLVAEVGSDFNNSTNKSLTTNHILTKLLRLAQITSGYASWDGDISPTTGEVINRNVEFFDPIPKIETLIDILKEKEDVEKTLIWSCFTPPIEKISKRLDEEGIGHVVFHGPTSSKQRTENENRFNTDPTCKVFLGNPKAGGTGLNLVGYPWWGTQEEMDACKTNTTQSIYYCMNWSSIEREQSSDRPHRKGTRVPVRTTDLCVPGTIDEEIRLRVVEKQMEALELADLRAVLKSVLDMELLV